MGGAKLGHLSGAFLGLCNITRKSLVKNLIIIVLCFALVLIQVFFPFYYYSSADRSVNSSFHVGIHYVYEQDALGHIYGEVAKIYNTGFRAMRINLHCDQSHYNSLMNRKTDELFSATDHFGVPVALVIQNDALPDQVHYYLNRWGHHLTFIQVLNEPELASSWSAGALFTDDEAISKFEKMYEVVKSHELPVMYYTNFGIGYIIRSNLPIIFSEKLHFVGLDIFMDSFLILSPHFINYLNRLTGRDVFITEFGMSTNDGLAQSEFIIKGLNLFKSMGLKGCWLVYWNSQLDDYGIRDKPAEKAVGDWIAQNTS
jgi:hypothetical protein